MNSVKRIQVAISLAAVVLIFVHLIWPNLKIDAVTVLLVVLAVMPWLTPLFKSLEIPGGLRFEFQELERVEKEAKEAGLVTDKPINNKSEYTFIEIAEAYPQLALASLRIEIEKSLKILAQKTKVACSECLNSKAHGAGYLIRDLYHKGVLSQQERSVLGDMLGTLNKAVHDEEVDERTAQWVIHIGPQILDSLRKKIEFEHH